MTTYYNYLGQPMAVSADPTSFVSGTSDGNQTLTAPAGPSGVSVNSGEYDTLIGSSGDNIFYVDDSTDQVQVADGLAGVKTVVSYAGGYALPANVQDLTFYGAGSWGVGNGENNLIIMGGNDYNFMDAEGGNAVLVGGYGQNNIGFQANQNSNVVIYNFHTNQDTVRITGDNFTGFSQIQSAMTQVGSDVVLKVDSTDSITFRNTTISSFTPNNFLMPLDTSLLGALSLDDEFNTLNLFDFSTGKGLWRTNFGGSPDSVYTYSIQANQEKEVYTDASFQGTYKAPLGFDPFSINNGVLTITAQNMGQASQYAFGQPYSSGMLDSKGIFEQQYGYFEMRAELPTAAGTWPAFWLSQDPYQPGTEADILEHLALYPNVDFARANDAGTVTGNTYYMPDASGFHTYGMLWTATTTSFYVDGQAVMEMPTPSSWNQPMYLMINLAVGGWGGPINDSQYPSQSQMQIDYVHAYSLADGSSIVVHETPAGPAGTLTATGSPTTLANSAGWTSATMLADGDMVLVSSINEGWGSHGAQGMIYDPATGDQIGSNISLYGYAAPGATMDPQVTAMPGSFWEVSFAGQGAPQGYDIYDGAGKSAFFDNQYTQGTPTFTPLSTGNHVMTDPAQTQFAVVSSSNIWTWYSDPTVNGQVTAPSEVHALSNGGFYFTYAGQTQLDVFDSTGAHDMQGQLGAPVSSFAMASTPLPDGQFGVAWLSPPAGGGFNMQLTFQLFGSDGAALTPATSVAADADPWHTHMEVLSTGAPGAALLLWSQGGLISGAYAQGSTVGPAQGLIVGDLDNTTQTSLTNGDVLLTWMQQDNGVQDLWAEVLNPSTMQAQQQQLGQADGNVSVVALADGAYAVSWHLGSQIEARGYDGEGDYGPTTTVAGDFVASDSAGHVVSIYQDAHGDAVLQHYAMTSYFALS